MKFYTEYAINYEVALSTLAALRKDKKIVAVLQTCLTPQENIKGDFYLGSLLVLPIQRIPRYEMLFKSLLKHTTEEHADYENLETAAATTEKLAQFIDQTKNEIQQRQSLFQLQNQLQASGKLVGGLVKPGRILVRQAIGTKEVSSSGSLLDLDEGDSYYHTIYLFNDLVMRVDYEGEEITAFAEVNLYKATIKARQGEGAVMVIGKGGFPVLAFLPRQEERTSWIRSVEDSIASAIEPKGSERNFDVMTMASLFAAASEGQTKRVEALLEAVESHSVEPKDGDYVGSGATASSHFVNMRDEEGRTPLYLAAQGGHTHTVQALLRMGANPSIASRTGQTPQEAANTAGHGEVANLFLRMSNKRVEDAWYTIAADSRLTRLSATAGKEEQTQAAVPGGEDTPRERADTVEQLATQLNGILKDKHKKHNSMWVTSAKKRVRTGTKKKLEQVVHKVKDSAASGSDNHRNYEEGVGSVQEPNKAVAKAHHYAAKAAAATARHNNMPSQHNHDARTLTLNQSAPPGGGGAAWSTQNKQTKSRDISSSAAMPVLILEAPPMAATEAITTAGGEEPPYHCKPKKPYRESPSPCQRTGLVSSLTSDEKKKGKGVTPGEKGALEGAEDPLHRHRAHTDNSNSSSSCAKSFATKGASTGGGKKKKRKRDVIFGKSLRHYHNNNNKGKAPSGDSVSAEAVAQAAAQGKRPPVPPRRLSKSDMDVRKSLEMMIAKVAALLKVKKLDPEKKKRLRTEITVLKKSAEATDVRGRHQYFSSDAGSMGLDPPPRFQHANITIKGEEEKPHIGGEKGELAKEEREEGGAATATKVYGKGGGEALEESPTWKPSEGADKGGESKQQQRQQQLATGENGWQLAHVLYNYLPREAGELHIETNEVVLVVGGGRPTNGWLAAQRCGDCGLVPSTHVRLLMGNRGNQYGKNEYGSGYTTEAEEILKEKARRRESLKVVYNRKREEPCIFIAPQRRSLEMHLVSPRSARNRQPQQFTRKPRPRAPPRRSRSPIPTGAVTAKEKGLTGETASGTETPKRVKPAVPPRIRERSPQRRLQRQKHHQPLMQQMIALAEKEGTTKKDKQGEHRETWKQWKNAWEKGQIEPKAHKDEGEEGKTKTTELKEKEQERVESREETQAQMEERDVFMRVRALFAYTAQSSDELSFRAKDQLVVRKSVGYGWYRGKHLPSGLSGLFPANYVEKVASKNIGRPTGFYGAFESTT